MGRAPNVRFDREQLETAILAYFEPALSKLGLTVGQIMDQSWTELQHSLETVRDAINHPESFGSMKVSLTADAGAIIAKASTEAHFEVGVLPLLLERKTLILERINTMRPAEQIQGFREEVTAVVADEQARARLLKVLDQQEAIQEELSTRIEAETADAVHALKAEAAGLTHAVTMARLEGRVESLEKAQGKFDDEKITKFDVVTITLTILTAVGALTGSVIAMVRWVTG